MLFHEIIAQSAKLFLEQRLTDPSDQILDAIQLHIYVGQKNVQDMMSSHNTEEHLRKGHVCGCGFNGVVSDACDHKLSVFRFTIAIEPACDLD
jgi:hypothetical protein